MTKEGVSIDAAVDVRRRCRFPWLLWSLSWSSLCCFLIARRGERDDN